MFLWKSPPEFPKSIFSRKPPNQLKFGWPVEQKPRFQ